MNSRGCARHERTPGNESLNAHHPGGVVPFPRTGGNARMRPTDPGSPSLFAQQRLALMLFRHSLD